MENNIRLNKPQVMIYHPLLVGGSIDLGEYAQSININNSLSSAVGSCQVTFQPMVNIESKLRLSNSLQGGNLRQILQKNTVISVKMNSGGRTKFLGLIDHILERTTTHNTSVGKSITINCSMLLPKLLVKDNIVNAPQLAILPEIKNDPVLKERAKFFKWERGLTEGDESVFSNKPIEAIKWILNEAPATNIPAIVINGKEISVQSFISDEADYTGQPAKDFNFVETDFLYAPELSVYSGTILNYLYSCIDKDFYEIYFDTTEDKSGFPLCKIVIRPKPFTYNQLEKEKLGWIFWDDLPTYAINSGERIEETIGQNDFEVKNFFQCYFSMDLIASANSNLGKFGYQFPIINIESVKKYGLRDLIAQSRLMNKPVIEEKYKKEKEAGNDPDVVRIADQEKGIKDPLLGKRNKLMYWYGYPHFESGQITVIGDDYRIGNKLFYEDKLFFDEETGKYIKGVEYYITGVSDSFRYPNTYTSTLTLTRGAPIGVVEEWFQKHEKDFIKIDKLGNSPSVKLIVQPKEIKDSQEVFSQLKLGQVKEIYE